MDDIKKLGKILLEEGMITEDQLESAITEQTKTSEPLGTVLLKLGYITEDVLYHFLAMQVGTKFIDVSILQIDDEVIKLIDVNLARKYSIIPIDKKPGKIIFATSNPLDPSLIMNLKYEIKTAGDVELNFVVTTDTALQAAIAKYYEASSILQETYDAIGVIDEDITIIEEKKVKDDDVTDSDIERSDSPVVKYVNYLIEDAAIKRASDVHITPFEKKILLRYRIDGCLVEMPPPKIQWRKALTSRIKLMAGMNIIEKRRPQDGRMKHTLSNKTTVDLRVSVIPSIWGENIVMRVINQDSQNLELKDLGMFDFQMKALEKALSYPYGMVLITGPTGSGKTTTVYAALTHINDPHDNIMTVEDPVEYRLPHIIQIQVNPEANLTFANVLRSFLRQDPDVMVVGEIRDDETASIAVKAALTGHLVLSTLHTNDAPTTVSRLVDMGIDPIYVGSSVLITIAQRLVRRVCEHCKEKIKEIDYVKAKKWGIPPEILEDGEYYEGAGCPNCHYTGYKGRIAAYEVLPMNTAIREIIFKKGTLNDLKREAWRQGMVTIRESAIQLMKQGITTLDEVVRETLQDKPLAEYILKKA
ncbi:MAG: Flp pilus assembly complex ATPase component TadA [Candidatus Goldbacteria bacterium]|nr:Flp pilus assembly complex ATPase component TadA [Candidatus Goldiibacteriota bacterium]